jgi:hypothetical protein
MMFRFRIGWFSVPLFMLSCSNSKALDSSTKGSAIMGASVQKPTSHCLAHHVSAGMAWNEKRKAHYEAMSSGESAKVSKKLIDLEKFMLVGSKVFDQFAVYWNDRNTPIFCLDMDEEVPPPAEPKALPIGEFVKLAPNGFKYFQLLAKEDWSEWEQQLNSDIQKGLEVPEFNCLTRHFLESMLRSSVLQRTVYPRKTKGLMRAYLMGLVVILPESQKIDALAAPLNAQGLGILCSDVPVVHIPQ